MAYIDKTFSPGEILKADDMNLLVSKINGNVHDVQVNDQSVVTADGVAKINLSDVGKVKDVRVYDKTGTHSIVDTAGNATVPLVNYQEKLVPGTGITIDSNNVISATGAGQSVSWTDITNKPSTISGYGITDAVQKETGKGLSTNDFTNDAKSVVSNIGTPAEALAIKNKVNELPEPTALDELVHKVAELPSATQVATLVQKVDALPSPTDVTTLVNKVNALPAEGQMSAFTAKVNALPSATEVGIMKTKTDAIPLTASSTNPVLTKSTIASELPASATTAGVVKLTSTYSASGTDAVTGAAVKAAIDTIPEGSSSTKGLVRLTSAYSATGTDAVTGAAVKAAIDAIPAATATVAGMVKVDTALSTTSTNPVQNKAISLFIGKLTDITADAATSDGTSTGTKPTTVVEAINNTALHAGKLTVTKDTSGSSNKYVFTQFGSDIATTIDVPKDLTVEKSEIHIGTGTEVGEETGLPVVPPLTPGEKYLQLKFSGSDSVYIDTADLSLTVDTDVTSTTTNPVEGKALYNLIGASNLDKTSKIASTISARSNVIAALNEVEANKVEKISLADETTEYSASSMKITIPAASSTAYGVVKTDTDKITSTSTAKTDDVVLSAKAVEDSLGVKLVDGVENAIQQRGSVASGSYAVAMGKNSQSWGVASFAEGTACYAIGDASHAEGQSATARASYSHAEGYDTEAKATAISSHVGGQGSKTEGATSFAHGTLALATNTAETAFGYNNASHKASDTFGNAGNTLLSLGVGNDGTRSNAVEVMQNGDFYVKGVGGYDGTNPDSAKPLQDFGVFIKGEALGSIDTDGSAIGAENTIASDAIAAMALGFVNQVSQPGGIAIGMQHEVTGSGAVAIGMSNKATDQNAFACGESTEASGDHSFASGYSTIAAGQSSFAGGSGAAANGNRAFAFGQNVDADGNASVAMGRAVNSGDIKASGDGSIAVGITENSGKIFASGKGAVAMGLSDSDTAPIVASGNYSVAMGYGPQATQQGSVALGYKTIAANAYAFSAGVGAAARGMASIAMGSGAEVAADKTCGVALGSDVKVNSEAGVAIGQAVTANNKAEIALGTFNSSHKASDTFGNAGNTALSVGIGIADNNKNAIEIMQNGSVYVQGVGGYVGDPTASGVKKLQDFQVFQTSGYTGSAQLVGYNASAPRDGATAIGLSTVASGVGSFAQGQSSKAPGSCAVATGADTNSKGANAFTAGAMTETNCYAEAAFGRANASHSATTDWDGNPGNTLFSIGIATDRSSGGKNAFEVMQNGDIYAIGVGGYDGTNSTADTTKKLQDCLGGPMKFNEYGDKSGVEMISTNDNYADGRCAFAVGDECEASGNYSIAMGQGVIAEGDNSIALGSNSHSSGSGAIAAGYGAGGVDTISSEGSGSVAAGYSRGSIHTGSEAKGSIAFGCAEGDGSITASGKGAVAMGLADGGNLTASGNGSVAMGKNSQALGIQSIAIGNESLAADDGTFAIGDGIKVTTGGLMSIGHYNDFNSIADFTIGNGTSDTTRSNALEITSDGIFVPHGRSMDNIRYNNKDWYYLGKIEHPALSSYLDAWSDIPSINLDVTMDKGELSGHLIFYMGSGYNLVNSVSGYTPIDHKVSFGSAPVAVTVDTNPPYKKSINLTVLLSSFESKRF